MEQNVIQLSITTPYFLTILGALVSGAWYFAAKISNIETDINSMKKDRERDRVEFREDIKELKDLIYKNK